MPASRPCEYPAQGGSPLRLRGYAPLTRSHLERDNVVGDRFQVAYGFRLSLPASLLQGACQPSQGRCLGTRAQRCLQLIPSRVPASFAPYSREDVRAIGHMTQVRARFGPRSSSCLARPYHVLSRVRRTRTARELLPFAVVVAGLGVTPEEFAEGPPVLWISRCGSAEDADLPGVGIDHHVRCLHGGEAEGASAPSPGR